jgi:hypothetical protein
MSGQRQVRRDPEIDFARTFEESKHHVTSDRLVESIKRARTSIARLAIVPSQSVIRNFDIVTRVPFTSASPDRERSLFLDACLACFEFVAHLSAAIDVGRSVVPFSGEVCGVLRDDWADCRTCKGLQHVLKCGFGILTSNDDLLKSSFTAGVFQFLADQVLRQTFLCQSRVFQLVLEVAARVFVFEAMANCEQRLKDLDNEGFQGFLRLVATISGLRRSSDIAERVCEDSANVLRFAGEYRTPSLFISYFRTLAALVKSEELAISLYDRVDRSVSDVVNIRHVFAAVKGHADDFRRQSVSEIDRRGFSEDDSSGIEAVLEFATAMFLYSIECQRMIADNEEFQFVDSVFQLILSPVPATLKARCFDALGALSRNQERAAGIWDLLTESQVLTQNTLADRNGGIIHEIDAIEADSRCYPMAQSFVRFLAFLLGGLADQKMQIDFEIYHQFILEQCLLRLRRRVFRHFVEKWTWLAAITQSWTNLLRLPIESCKPVFRSLLGDHELLSELLRLILEEDAPLETLFCVFRLFLQVADRQNEFLGNKDDADRSLSFDPIERLLSRNQDVLVKLIHCIKHRDFSFQIVFIHLVQRIAAAAPDTSQVVFCGTRAKAVRIFRKIITRNEAEVPVKKNIRNTLLSSLRSLGANSFFLRSMCGYDMTDLPRSLLQSRLNHGILLAILNRLQESNSAQEFPHFVTQSLKLMFGLADDPWTAFSALALIRSSQAFFHIQRELLQNPSAELTCIGCYLRLLAREARVNQSGASRITTNAFLDLFGQRSFHDGRSRVVLVHEFLDRMDDSKKSVSIGLGLEEILVAIKGSAAITKRLEESKISPWPRLLRIILEKAELTNRPDIANFLTEVCYILTGDKEQSKEKLFNLGVRVLKALHDKGFREAKLGIYALFMKMDCSKFEKARYDLFFAIAADDLQTEIPIVRSAIFQAAERVVFCPRFAEASAIGFVSEALNLFSAIWSAASQNPGVGFFPLRSMIAFFTRACFFPDLRNLLVRNGIILHFRVPTFWESMLTQIVQHPLYDISLKELTLSTCVQVMQLLALLFTFFRATPEVVDQFKDFFEKLEQQFIGFLNFPETARFGISGLWLFDNLCQFTILAPAIFDTLPNLKGEIQKTAKGIKVSKWRTSVEDDSGKQKTKKKFAIRDELLEKIQNYFKSNEFLC